MTLRDRILSRLGFGPATACELTVLALQGVPVGGDQRPVGCVQQAIFRLVKTGLVRGAVVGNHPVYVLVVPRELEV